ncbi:MAG: translation initiation factor [Rhizonema sp. PD37]|nr:translation initiation factor [Rhizonema sp. PD37]
MVGDFLRKIIGGGDEERADEEGNYGDRGVRPASEDPYGDPADQGYGNPGGYGQYGDVRPASEDPYGDPADQGYGDVRPASEDPYGDPADQNYG